MIQVVIKPTGSCNLSCLYCNVEQKSRTKISLDRVKVVLKLLSDKYSDDTVLIRWHGGEPLLMGKDFFAAVVQFQRSMPTKFENEISSNLMLLDDGFLSFFKENEFAIYTSLDAVGAAHDHQRDKSFTRVKESLLRLKDYRIDNVTVRSTVTKYTVDRLEHVYDLCRSLNFKWEFGVVIPAGLQRVKALELLVNPDDFSHQAIKIFDRWLKEKTLVEVPVFQNIINYFMKREQYIFDTKPRLSIGSDGVIYACPLLIGNENYALGDVIDPISLEKFCTLTCSEQRIDFTPCEHCYFEFFCKLIHCTYLFQIHNFFPALCEYLCHCWKPVYLHIYESVFSEISPNNNQNDKEINHAIR